MSFNLGLARWHLIGCDFHFASRARYVRHPVPGVSTPVIPSQANYFPPLTGLPPFRTPQADALSQIAGKGYRRNITPNLALLWKQPMSKSEVRVVSDDRCSTQLAVTIDTERHELKRVMGIASKSRNIRKVFSLEATFYGASV
jgi:hypothetical protein